MPLNFDHGNIFREIRIRFVRALRSIRFFDFPTIFVFSSEIPTGIVDIEKTTDGHSTPSNRTRSRTVLHRYSPLGAFFRNVSPGLPNDAVKTVPVTRLRYTNWAVNHRGSSAVITYRVYTRARSVINDDARIVCPQTSVCLGSCREWFRMFKYGFVSVKRNNSRRRANNGNARTT